MRRLSLLHRSAWALVGLTTALPVVGCYAYQPIQSAPAPGMTLSMVMTDQGRVLLGSRIGESVREIQADLDSVTPSGFAVRMRTTVTLNGAVQRWVGEPLLVPAQAVTNVRERRFSRTRTAIAVGGTIGAFAAFVATRSLLGKGGTDRDKTDGDSSTQ